MPDQPVMTFISYSRVQEALARRFYNDLAAAGVHVWLDRYDIPPGAVWDDAIQQGLDACQYVLILVTQAAISSRHVHAEWNYADGCGKNLIPVICEPLTPQQIPFRLHTANWVNLTEIDYDAALKNLLAVLPASEAPNPAAAPEPDHRRPASPEPDPVAAAAAWKRGNAEFHDEQFDAALHTYTEAIQLAPDRAEAYIHRGMVRYSLKQYQDALADFIQAQQRDPDMALLYNDRGVTYLALKNTGQALADLQEAILLDPGYSNAYYNLAAVWMALGRYRLATAFYTRALDINDRVPLYYNSRGLSYAAQKLYEAVADYDRVIALNPEHHLAYAGRSELHWCGGDYARAALDASTVIGLQPDFHGGYALRALANFRRGQREPALTDYARAIQLDPAWQTPGSAAAYLTICPDDERQTVRDILAALGEGQNK
jgi:tetratricopeptide (TPR) repeat protein